MPLFPGPDSTRIFEICPPDELHLLLGITKHIVDSLNEEWGQNQLNDWLEIHGVRREKYYNGVMNGNACNKLLNKKLHLLRRKVPKKHLKFISALEAFNKVKKSCFGKVLSPTTRRDIEKFKQAFSKLEINYTPKIHVLIDHVANFCEEFGSLAYFSTQAGESAHSDFKGTIKHYWVDEMTNPDIFAKKLLAGVNKYNSKHIYKSLAH